MRLPSLFLLFLLASGCTSSASPPVGENGSAATDQAQAGAPGAIIKPPFQVRHGLEGLLLVWIDAEGAHQASEREAIPPEHRRFVRVQSLRAGPDSRPDGDRIFVADLRQPAADGSYTVRMASRDWFEARAEAATPAMPASAVQASDEVVLYMASWCGACKAAARYMKQRDVAFLAKDIEKDPAAAAEMRQKAKAAGKRPRGVPVIDYRGTLMMGFDQRALGALIDKSS